MENVLLTMAGGLKKTVKMTSTISSVGKRDSSLQIQEPGLSDLTFNIVPFNTFTPSQQSPRILYRHWIVLTGSVLNQTWYIASCLENSGDNIALIGALRRSWIKALIYFMRFKRERLENLFRLYDELYLGSPLARMKLAADQMAKMSAKLEERAKRQQEIDNLLGM